MSPVLPLAARPSPCREPDSEETFLRHYDRLFIYALYLTDNCPSQAEDLLHDAFLAVMLGQIDLSSAQEFEKYICGVLRHFHVFRVRRASRRPMVPLSALEYDSVSLLLNARIEEGASFQEELNLILQHAGERKSVSKSASVLLLDRVVRTLEKDFRPLLREPSAIDGRSLRERPCARQSLTFIRCGPTHLSAQREAAYIFRLGPGRFRTSRTRLAPGTVELAVGNRRETATVVEAGSRI